jgi:hypothetical protein
MARIFISYSRKDEVFALSLEDSLSSVGADYWIDKAHIRAGENWRNAIDKALKLCDVMLLVISPDSVASRHVQEEWQYFHSKDKPIIPLIYRPAELHYQLESNERIVFHLRPYDKAFAELHRQLIETGVTLKPLPRIDPILDSTSSQFPFTLRHNKIAFTSNFANPFGCKWQGLGGGVFDINGLPLPEILIHVYGGNDNIDLYSASGTNVLYWPNSGWEVQVDTVINAGTYFVELRARAGVFMSPTVQITFPNTCDGNLAIVNFEQIRPFVGTII